MRGNTGWAGAGGADAVAAAASGLGEPAAAAAAGRAAGCGSPAAPAAPAARLRFIRRPKRTLGALALGLCALGVAIGSGADFSAQTANPSNTFTAGSLKMDNSRDGSAIFAPTNMKPGGQPQTGIVDIRNTGSIDGVFTLHRDQLTSSDTGLPNPIPFAARVDIKIVDCGKFTPESDPYGPATVAPACGDSDDFTVYDGTLAGESSAHGLGVYHPGDAHRYRFAGSLDVDAGNEYADDGSSARYVFDTVQTP